MRTTRPIAAAAEVPRNSVELVGTGAGATIGAFVTIGGSVTVTGAARGAARTGEAVTGEGTTGAATGAVTGEGTTGVATGAVTGIATGLFVRVTIIVGLVSFRAGTV